MKRRKSIAEEKTHHYRQAMPYNSIVKVENENEIVSMRVYLHMLRQSPDGLILREVDAESQVTWLYHQ